MNDKRMSWVKTTGLASFLALGLLGTTTHAYAGSIQYSFLLINIAYDKDDNDRYGTWSSSLRTRWDGRTGENDPPTLAPDFAPINNEDKDNAWVVNDQPDEDGKYDNGLIIQGIEIETDAALSELDAALIGAFEQLNNPDNPDNPDIVPLMGDDAMPSPSVWFPGDQATLLGPGDQAYFLEYVQTIMLSFFANRSFLPATTYLGLTKFLQASQEANLGKQGYTANFLLTKYDDDTSYPGTTYYVTYSAVQSSDTDTGGGPTIPEPGSLALLGLGLAGLGVLRRRRLKAVLPLSA